MNGTLGCSICEYSSCPTDCDSIFWECRDDSCLPKDLEFNEPFDYIIIVVAMFVSYFGSIVGMGGGSVLVPVILLMTSFSTDVIVSLVSVSILASGIVQYTLYSRIGRREEADLPQVNYNIPLVQVPSFANLAFLGALLNQVAPAWVLLVTVLLVFTISSIKGVYATIESCKKRKEEKPAAHTTPPPRINFCQKKILVRLMILFLIYTSIALFSYFRERYKSHDWQYWAIFGGQCSSTIIILALVFRHLVKNEKLDPDYGWTIGRAMRLSGVTSFVGVFASFVGAGGGVIMVPYQIHEKIPTKVIVASGSLILSFATASTIIQYLFVSPVFLYRYSIAFFISSGIGGFLGLMTLRHYIYRYHHYGLQMAIMMMMLIVSMALLILSIIVEL